MMQWHLEDRLETASERTLVKAIKELHSKYKHYPERTL